MLGTESRASCTSGSAEIKGCETTHSAFTSFCLNFETLSSSPDWPWTSYVAEPKFLIFLHLSLECWDYECFAYYMRGVGWGCGTGPWTICGWGWPWSPDSMPPSSDIMGLLQDSRFKPRCVRSPCCYNQLDSWEQVGIPLLTGCHSRICHQSASNFPR